ncbi:MAG: hypothetical protein ACYC65_14890 [Candidatus Limnocylindrales bacterium]
MTIDRRLIAGALGVSLILAACGGSSTASSSAAPTGSPTAATDAPAPTEAAESASAEPTELATEDATSGIEPSFVPGAASDLEAMLPDEAAGVKFQKSSFDGASLGILGSGIDTAELEPILKANGKTINDIRVAIAGPVDTTATDGGMVIAFQIRGLDASKFMAAMSVDPAAMTDATIGGKQVLQTGTAGFLVIVYTKGDVLFEVLLASDAVAESILSQLP